MQQRSAMKIGTDGVLLGAWVNITGVNSALDIGTGTGVIAIMLAQRSPEQTCVTGIEIEQNAAAEAAENAAGSAWNKRISIRHESFQDFAQNHTEQFDLIVSNPPFFANSQKPLNAPLSIARHNHLLPASDLIKGCEKLLSPGGKLAIILPVGEAREFITNCKKENLYVQRLTEVRPNYLKPPHRYLMELGRVNREVIADTLKIQTDDGAGFTNEYKHLTRDFYLHF